MTLSSDDYFGNIPGDIQDFLVMPRLAIHPTGLSAWAHPGVSSIMPHSHLIREDWPIEFKNQMAVHIEQFHKSRRRT